MATPTTAYEIQMFQEAFEKHVHSWRDAFEQCLIVPMIDLLIKRLFLQRPHTDDMMQMCVDLGVDVPDFQPISYDGLTFKWR